MRVDGAVIAEEMGFIELVKYMTEMLNLVNMEFLKVIMKINL